MEEYTTYCTFEQIKLAYELGAPIEKLPYREWEILLDYVRIDDYVYKIPTAEQLINWLDTKDVLIQICNKTYWLYSINNVEGVERYKYREFATLVAIDSALDYLKNKKYGKSI